MSQTRLFQAINFAPNSEITLDENASHHLAKVLRVRIGDPIILFNGKGGEYSATIKKIDKKNVIAHVEKFIARDAESPLNIILAQGISRGERMDYTVQKATEVGVKKIIPLITERCNVKLDQERMAKKIEHWQAVATSAAEQSGRTQVPLVEEPIALTEWLKKDQSRFKLILDPDVNFSIKSLHLTPQEEISLLVGPEGGLSEVEINQSVKEGFTAVKLGPRILRTETAGIVAISILQSQYGDMS